jgi:hypothetical protein
VESGCTRSTGKGLSSVTRDELSQIVAELIVMAGLQGVDFVDTLPRRLYFRILSILRPAEYAARRIILIAACKLEWDIRVVEAKKRTKPAESLTSPLRGSEGRVETGGSTPEDLPRSAKPGGMANRVSGVRSGRQCRPIDNDLSIGATNARSESEGQGHRVPAFDLFDPAKDYGKFFLTDAEYAALMKAREEARYLPVPYHSPDEPVNAMSLSRRIRALADAMQNIDRARHPPCPLEGPAHAQRHQGRGGRAEAHEPEIAQPLPADAHRPAAGLEETSGNSDRGSRQGHPHPCAGCLGYVLTSSASATLHLRFQETRGDGARPDIDQGHLRNYLWPGGDLAGRLAAT